MVGVNLLVRTRQVAHAAGDGVFVVTCRGDPRQPVGLDSLLLPGWSGAGGSPRCRAVAVGAVRRRLCDCAQPAGRAAVPDLQPLCVAAPRFYLCCPLAEVRVLCAHWLNLWLLQHPGWFLALVRVFWLSEYALLLDSEAFHERRRRVLGPNYCALGQVVVSELKLLHKLLLGTVLPRLGCAYYWGAGGSWMRAHAVFDR